jgi:hypothetical protein
MAIEGSLDVFQLPEILQMISGQRKTGILTVQGESDIVAVSFKDGQVVAADALNQTVEEGLGQILASQGLVSPRDFSAVTLEHEAGGKRLLDLLLERGHVHRSQLLDALRLQTYRLLLQLLRWEAGEFKFYAGEEVAYEEGFYAISVEELLIRSLEDLGDETQGDAPDLDAVYERVPGAPPVRMLEANAVPPEGGSGVWLAPEDRPFLERIDGATSARAVASACGANDYRALFTLYKLLRGGVIRAVTARQPAAARAPASPAPAGPASVQGQAPRAVAGATAAVPSGAGPPARAQAPVPAGGGRDSALPEVPADADDVVAAPQPPTRGPKVVQLRAGAPAQASGVAVFAPVLAAMALAIGILAIPWLAPRHLLLPFPWQDGSRTALERNQRAAQYLLIDRAARTYFLLEGHYPDDLQELVTLELLPASALRDPAGNSLAYATEEVSYEVQPVRGGASLPELAAREAVTGDFLLDPQFLALPDRPERAPLVLLD